MTSETQTSNISERFLNKNLDQLLAEIMDPCSRTLKPLENRRKTFLDHKLVSNSHKIDLTAQQKLNAQAVSTENK